MRNYTRAHMAWACVLLLGACAETAAPVTVEPEAKAFTAPSPQADGAQAAYGSASRGATGGLPAAGTSVREVVTSLGARAEAGDAKAACRIAIDLVECVGAQRRLQAAESTANALPPELAAKVSSTLLASTDLASQMCVGVTVEQAKADAYRYQALAAQNGPAAYKRWLVASPALDRGRMLDDVEQWADYKRRARAYFDDALRRKSLDDLSLLLLVHAPRDVMISRPPYQVDNPAAFLALYEIAQQNGIDPPQQVRRAASAIQLDQPGRSQLQKLRREYGGAWRHADPGQAFADPTVDRYDVQNCG